MCSFKRLVENSGLCEEIFCRISVNGTPFLDAAELQKVKIPLICHFANKNDWCRPAKVNELEAALKRSNSKFELHRYDTQHAFMHEARPEVYDVVSAKTAWERTFEFLKKTLA